MKVPLRHSPISVANKFLELAAAAGETLTPLQLIKLVYLSHGFMLGLYRRPLVSEDVQAYTYGPVFPTLYRAVKEFRSSPVAGPLAVQDGSGATKDRFGELEDDVIRQVYQKYGRRNGIQLSRLTHQPDSPWSQVWDEGRGHGQTISNDLLEDYFSALTAH
jgi:uncharacterized phage-associated protein